MKLLERAQELQVGFPADTRTALRRHFETDAAHVVVAVLKALADTDEGKAEDVADAIVRYDIDPEAIEPRLA
jgi:pyruvate dehydrogenase E1 component